MADDKNTGQKASAKLGAYLVVAVLAAIILLAIGWFTVIHPASVDKPAPPAAETQR